MSKTSKVDSVSSARSRFESGIQHASDLFDESLRLSGPASNRAVEGALLHAAVLTEGFLSEWFIRCAWIDPSGLVANIETRVSNWLNVSNNLAGKLKNPKEVGRPRGADACELLPAMVKATLAAPTLAEIEALLGATDINKSFRDSAALQVDASMLAMRHRELVRNLPPPLCAVFDLTTALRNALAHRSRASSQRLSESIQATALPVSLKRGRNYGVSLDGIPTYLRAAGHPSTSLRFQIITNELRALAGQLVPKGFT